MSEANVRVVLISATDPRDSLRTPRASQVAYPSSEGYVTLSIHGFSDMESERPGTSTVDPDQWLGVNVCSPSVDPNPEPSSSNIGYTPPTRSVHYKDNRSGHVPVEEAESCKGEEFIESQPSRPPQKNTPPTLSFHRGWAKGRGRGLRLGGAKNFSV